MILELKVYNDNGDLVAEARGPATQPLSWKAPPGHPLIQERPTNEQGTPNGCYKIWAISAVPTVTLDLNYRKIGEGIGQPVQHPLSPPPLQPSTGSYGYPSWPAGASGPAGVYRPSNGIPHSGYKHPANGQQSPTGFPQSQVPSGNGESAAEGQHQQSTGADPSQYNRSGNPSPVLRDNPLGGK